MSHPVLIITMQIALSGSVRNAMPVVIPAMADTQRIAPPALLLQPSDISYSSCAGLFAQADITLATLPMLAYFALSISTVVTAPIKTLPAALSAHPVRMATSYKVAHISVNHHATPISSPISATTHASPVIHLALLVVGLVQPHA